MFVTYYNDDGDDDNDNYNYFYYCQRFPKLDGADPALLYRQTQALSSQMGCNSLLKQFQLILFIITQRERLNIYSQSSLSKLFKKTFCQHKQWLFYKDGWHSSKLSALVNVSFC